MRATRTPPTAAEPSPAVEPTPPPANVPEQFSPPQEAYASFPDRPGAAAAGPVVPSACQLRLAKLAVFKPLPVLIGAGECGAVDAVILENVILPDEAKVPVSPSATRLGVRVP